MKMVADDATREGLGVSMVGVNGGEVIHEAAMGLCFKASIDGFMKMIHV
jgi:pyruvate/2-oxoglutarate dehydrogenase complex dihydrolipoamide dehydrogenase (E3) component